MLPCATRGGSDAPKRHPRRAHPCGRPTPPVPRYGREEEGRIGASHVSAGRLVAFAEQSLGEIDRARIYVHLRCCESCLERYEELIRSTQQSSPAPAEAVDSARPAGKGSRRAVRRRRLAGSRTLGMRDGLRSGAVRGAVATLLVAAVAVSAWWLRPIGSVARYEPDSKWLQPVALAMTQVSQRQEVVMPGVEDYIGPTTGVGAGGARVDYALDAALAALARRYNNGRITADEMHWLIGGYMATGFYAHASDYATAALRRFSEHADILVMGALAARGTGELERARELLEEAASLDPENAVVLVNLGVVLKELGHHDEAARSLRRARSLSQSNALSLRAQALLDNLSTQ